MHEDYDDPAQEGWDYGKCPACGAPIDYCQGHGEIGDPHGFSVMRAHDNGDHRTCHPDGCEEWPDSNREVGQTFTNFGDDVGN